MKTPIYETTPGALMALMFANGPTGRTFADFDCYTINCPQGPVLRYTTCDRDVSFGGNTWQSGSVRIEPASSRTALYHAKVGLDVDTWQAVFYPRPVDDLTGAAYPDTIGSVPWLQAAAAGVLSGATVTVDRAFFAVPLATGPVYLVDGFGTPVVDGYGNPVISIAATYPGVTISPTGALRIFAGRVAEVDMGRTGAALTIDSHLELLNVQIPVNLFQASCRHRLFDSGCTLSVSAYAANGTCGTGSTRNVLVSSLGAPAASGTYTLGRITITSGPNAGFSRTVRSWDGTHWTLQSPLPFTINGGETFTAYPGCNKTEGTCAAFGNTANFGGQPWIPAPETAS